MIIHPEQYRCYENGDLHRESGASLAKTKTGVLTKKDFDESNIKKAVRADMQVIPVPTAGTVL